MKPTLDILAANAAAAPSEAEYRTAGQAPRRSRREFKIGQLWMTRAPEGPGSDLWRIEAISDHPISPVIARHSCGAIRCFGLDGHMDGDEEACRFDLVTLIEGAL